MAYGAYGAAERYIERRAAQLQQQNPTWTLDTAKREAEMEINRRAAEILRQIPGSLLHPNTIEAARARAISELMPGGLFPDDTLQIDYKPELHNWIGPQTKLTLSDYGKLVTFGPAPPGYPSNVEAAVLLIALLKLGKTSEGLRVIQALGVKYLDTVGKVLTAISNTNASNFMTACINNYVACTIYQRMGLMSPHDAAQTRAWLDHQTGEYILSDRVMGSLGNLTTLVTSTSETTKEDDAVTKVAGLAAIAKLFEGK